MSRVLAVVIAIVVLGGCGKTASSSFLSRCHSSSECGGGLTCPSSGFFADHCTLSCGGTHSDDDCQAAVGAHAYCDTAGYCGFSCAGASCPTDFTCMHDPIGFAYCSQ